MGLSTLAAPSNGDRYLAIATPPGWTTADLLRPAADHGLAGRIHELVERTPQLGQRKAELLSVLDSTLDACVSGGVIAAYTLSQDDDAADVPLMATVTFATVDGTLLGDEEGSDAEGIFRSLGSDDSERTSVVSLPAGRAIRGESTQAVCLVEDGPGMLVLSVRYLLAIPGTARYVVASFATPMVAVAREWVQLFDRIAASLGFE